MASYVHTHEITQRLRVVPEMEIGDGSVQQNVITAVVVVCRCEDSDNPDLGVASTDPWVSLDLDACTAADFDPLADMTALPDRCVAYLDQWAADQREGLEQQLAGRVNAPREETAPWAGGPDGADSTSDAPAA
jgi:hypothetical protein